MPEAQPLVSRHTVGVAGTANWSVPGPPEKSERVKSERSPRYCRVSENASRTPGRFADAPANAIFG
ncbi:hypothetical protein [Amycolatopsis sp. NPDC003731]